MALYSGPERKLMKVGAKKASTWGPAGAVAVGAGSGVDCKDVTGFKRVQELLRAESVDGPIPRQGQLDVVNPVEAAIITDMLYDFGALGMLIALLFVTAGAPTGPTGGTAYTHTFQWADSSWGKFATLVRTIPGKVEEIQSFKPLSWILKSSNGGIIESELAGVGNNVIHDSTVNQEAQINAITYDDRTIRVLFREQVVKMNDQSAGDVAAATALNCTSVELTFKRQEPDYLHPSGQYDILEPPLAGYDLQSVKLTFPRYDAVNDAFFATAIAETTQKMLVKYTSAQLAGTAIPYSLSLFFPRLRMKVPDPDWKKIVANGLELVSEEALVAPTGMTYTRPYLVVVNKRSTDYLA